MKTDIDHKHIMIIVPPKYAVSEVVRIIKTNNPILLLFFH
ncbi:MAG: transposase [Spirochaetales bacterium]|nr:transposase [Spirochaetales bacterium]